MELHRCPICGAAREVPPERAQFAYGRQLTCSPDCEAERRRRSRAPYRLHPGPIPGILTTDKGELHAQNDDALPLRQRSAR